jgi:hypothetical protein
MTAQLASALTPSMWNNEIKKKDSQLIENIRQLRGHFFFEPEHRDDADIHGSVSRFYGSKMISMRYRF